MSLKPIDLHVMMPKSSEISKVYSDSSNKNNVFQQQQASLSQNKADNDLKHVHSKENAQQAGVREKQERDKRRQEKERQNKSAKGSRKRNQDTNGSTSIIDIRL